MISDKEFEVIRTLLKTAEKLDNIPEYIFKNVHYAAFKDSDEVAKIVRELEEKGYIVDASVTDIAKKEIEALKVNNAVILG